jgi:hypothetical protein
MNFKVVPVGLENLISLSFHPYKAQPNRSSHASWPSVLVQTSPELRGGDEVESDLAFSYCEHPTVGYRN